MNPSSSLRVSSFHFPFPFPPLPLAPSLPESPPRLPHTFERDLQYSFGILFTFFSFNIKTTLRLERVRPGRKNRLARKHRPKRKRTFNLLSFLSFPVTNETRTKRDHHRERQIECLWANELARLRFGNRDSSVTIFKESTYRLVKRSSYVRAKECPKKTFLSLLYTVRPRLAVTNVSKRKNRIFSKPSLKVYQLVYLNLADSMADRRETKRKERGIKVLRRSRRFRENPV